MKIVIDTNVIASGIFWSGPPSDVLDRWSNDEFVVLASPIVLDEYIRVIKELASRNEMLAKNWVDFLPSLVTLIEPKFRTQACRDSNDNMFLEVAVSGDANFIVTGDKDLLCMKEFHKIQIIEPKIFLTKLKKQGESNLPNKSVSSPFDVKGSRIRMTADEIVKTIREQRRKH